MDADPVETLTRRESLQRLGTGGLGAVAGASLSASALQQSVLAADRSLTTGSRTSPGKGRSLLVVWLEGGCSAVDTWDPKPHALREVGLREISTSVPGVSVSELFPQLAQRMHWVTLLRGLTSDQRYGCAAEDHARARAEWFGSLNGSSQPGDFAATVSSIGDQSGPQTLGQRIPDIISRLQQGPAQLLVRQTGFDSHTSHAESLRLQAASLDGPLSGLLDELRETGLWETTTLAVLTEFGRSNPLNAWQGRDHWGQAFSGLLAGAEIPAGQVRGRTDTSGREVIDDPWTVSQMSRWLASLSAGQESGRA